MRWNPPRTRSSLQARLGYLLLLLFCFLGPIGRLLPLPGTPSSFRFYYLLLLPGLVVFLQLGHSRRDGGRMFALLLIGLYVVFSSIATLGRQSTLGASDSTLFRAGLLVALAGFSISSGGLIGRLSEFRRMQCISVYLKGYLVSVAAGFAIMFAIDVLRMPASTFQVFDVITQVGYGLRRFSPGSYPNEYGNVSSFALSVLLMLMLEMRIRRSELARSLLPFRGLELNLLLVPFVLTALFLATTRSAYLSFMISMVYVVLRTGLIITPRVVRAAVVVSILLTPLAMIFWKQVAEKATMVTSVLGKGAYHAIEGSGSLGQRYNDWEIALQQFQRRPWFGTGFAQAIEVHNLYLQLATELGVLGLVVLAMAGLITVWCRPPLFTQDQQSASLIRAIRNLALFHIAFFAMSNHNLNHHLTWFGCILIFLTPRFVPPPALPAGSMVSSPRVRETH